MSFWGLVQLFLDLLLVASAGFLWVKLNRPAKDDPRLSRGLQLLGSKISIIEDLSDRTETQVKQLTALMEQKVREIQNTLIEAEKQIQKIEASMSKSLEVAKIFQDKIPHQEIIERQNTIKYVKAARLAHSGLAVEEIMQQVDLPRGEVEFIAKVNRDQLQFSEADLPEWVSDPSEPASPPSEVHVPVTNKPTPVNTMSQAVPLPHQAHAQETQMNRSLQGLGEQFRVAMNSQIPQSLIDTPTQNPRASVRDYAARDFANRETNRDSTVKKVVFPRIDA